MINSAQFSAVLTLSPGCFWFRAEHGLSDLKAYFLLLLFILVSLLLATNLCNHFWQLMGFHPINNACLFVCRLHKVISICAKSCWMLSTPSQSSEERRHSELSQPNSSLKRIYVHAQKCAPICS